MSEFRYDVFLSHNREDADAALLFARRLRDEAGIEPFLDTWHLVPGEPWQEAIERALDSSQTCAVLLGPSGLGTWDNEQMRAALDIRASSTDFRVIPILLPGAALPERGKLPRFLARLTWVDFRAGLDDAAAFHALVSGIQGVAPGEGEMTAPAVCPFRGLQVFEEENAEFFFGREALVQHLVEALRQDRFLAVSGPSGSGKSSLVRAGVLPKVRTGALPDSASWDVLLFKPGAHPLDTLSAHLLPLLGAQLDPVAARNSLLESFRRDERGLHNAVQLALGAAPPGKRVLVVADQFEEIFTLTREEDERTAFIANLLYAGTIAGGQTLVLLTLRSDFLSKCALYGDLAARLDRLALVGPMDPAELRRAMTSPAEKVGLHFEKGLVETILDDIGSEPGSLPLLQHTLLELWERRRGAWLTTDAYQEIGGVRGALAKRADAIYAALTPAQQHAARSILLRLTVPGEGNEGTRRRAEMSELQMERADAGDAQKVIDRLADARLLTTSKDERGVEIVDVSHEALIRGWPLLRGWIDADREALRTQRRITEAAGEWVAKQRDASYLYRGARLAQAEEWSKAHPDALNWMEREFLQSSLDARDRERAVEQARRDRELASAKRIAEEAEARRVAETERAREAELRAQEQTRAAGRLRRFAVGLAGLFALAALLAAAAFWLLGESNRANALALSRQRAYAANSALGTNSERALLLAILAGRTAPTFEADTALREALAAPGRSLAFMRADSESLLTGELSPDGKYAATASTDGTARIWDAATGVLLHVLDTRGSPVKALAWNNNGSRLATGGAERAVRIWDAHTGQPLLTWDAPGGINVLAWNRDGTRLVTGHLSGEAMVWDAATGEPLVQFHEHSDSIQRAAWNPVDERIVTASYDHTARVWDSVSGAELAVLNHTDKVLDAAWDPAGKRIASVGFDGKPRVWDAAGAALLSELKGHTSALWSVRWNPVGTRIATASSDGTARVWDASSGEELLQLAGGGEVLHIEWESGGRRLLTGGSDGVARVWDAGDGRLLAAMRGDGHLQSVGWNASGTRVFTANAEGTARVWDPTPGYEAFVLRAQDKILDAAWHSNPGRILTVGSDKLPRVWDAATGALLAELKGHTEAVRNGAFSRNGSRVVTASYDNTARVWEAETGKELLVLRGHTDGVWTVAWDADDSQIVTASLDGTARVWDIAGALASGAREAKTRFILDGHGGVVSYAAWSPDQKHILTADADGAVRIWDSATGALVQELREEENSVGAAAWSPNSARVAIGYADGSIRVREASSGAQVGAFGAHASNVHSIAWNREGTRIVTAGRDGTVRVWDASSGRELLLLARHRGPVQSAEWSSDGARIVTAGDDGTARIWDAATGAELAVLLGHAARIRRALWIAGDSQILTASEDSTVRVHYVRLEDLLRVACERAPRNLSATEWQQYMGREPYRETCPGKPVPDAPEPTPETR